MYNYFLFNAPTHYSLNPQVAQSPNSPNTSQQITTQNKSYEALHQKYNQLKEKYNQLEQKNKELTDYVLELEEIIEPQTKKKRIKRRTENQLSKQHKCFYKGCKKEYASKLALNLHIRNKHGGGTKKDRIAYIKQVIEAQEKGQQQPKTELNIPAEVLEYEIKYYTNKLKSGTEKSSELQEQDKEINPSQNQDQSLGQH